MVLLLWTAIDMLNERVCAADNVAFSAAEAHLLQAGPADSGPLVPEHDDCFCCSHTVTVPTLVGDVQPGPVIAARRTITDIVPSLIVRSLDRPPQDVR